MKDICCVGHITKDTIITTRQTVNMTGGTAFYFAYAINALPRDIDFTLLTKISQQGQRAVMDMRLRGIDVVARHSAHTVWFENTYGLNPDERAQRLLEKADPFTVEDVRRIDARIYHLGSLTADDFSAELVEFLAAKGMVSCDAQGFLRKVDGKKISSGAWTDKERFLRHISVIQMDEQEIIPIAETDSPRDAARRLAALGVKEIVITLGSRGSIIYNEGQLWKIPAYKAKTIVDVTGCGDTYSAGFLYSRATGHDIDYSGRFAAAMCTLKIGHNGPFAGNIHDIQRIMRRH